ncbi:putative c6 transcription protein [Neofusicoccum parvum UCRNP2]|uniref:Putative c6 transcription protein n=1 Tax=Botryosphaeria parva (strain UCR-NP2) TaxID=1287680 RepID=R1EY74_BOTPV|nr:putative c6 transcription protein [Neofusicoccum parvum UCRNP2]
MTLQLGLRDYVANQGNDFSGRSTIPPRLLPLPCTIIDREERIRAYWMTELLDSISTLGAGWNSTISPPPDVSAVLPCSDSIWAFPEHIINIWSIGEFHFSSAFSLCIILSTSELWHVHRFLQQSFDLRIYEQKSRFQAESQQIDERLTTWRAEFVAAVYRLINTEHAQEERAEMDPNIVLTNCILDCAVIILFQRLSPSPAGITAPCDPWPYATNRCIYAADDLSAKLRQASDAELRVANPNLLAAVFAAARFYLVYAKAVGAELPRNLRVLVRALRVCGERWELARRLGAVLQAAAAEHQVPVFMSSLPVQFFDPQFSSLEVGDAVVDAAGALEEVMGLGVLGGAGPEGAVGCEAHVD